MLILFEPSSLSVTNVSKVDFWFIVWQFREQAVLATVGLWRVEPDNYLLIPQSFGISMGICTYTFGISLLIPKQHDKSSHFHNRFSRDLGQFFQISLVRFPGHLTHGICYIVAHEEVRVIFALLVRFGRDSSGGLGTWSGNSWVSSWSMACLWASRFKTSCR